MDLGDAIRLKPTLYDARSLRGVIYYDGDRWDNALEDFNYVLERSPKDAQSLLGRGVIHLRREELPAAEKDFRAFLKEHPNHAFAPKLRHILASLSGSHETTPSPTHVSQSAPAADASPRHSSAQIQALADSLMRRQNDLSDGYTRKVLQGQRGEVVGDITTHPGSEGTRPAPASSNVDIVDPH